MLRNNQSNAVTKSIKNNFSSGIHCHATGTGKSWIALEIIIAFNKIFSNKNILWLCEHKSILIEQFNYDNLKSRGYEKVYDIFNIINFSENKKKEWINDINNYNNSKPILLIINRSFLVSKKKYELINKNISLIIHDECHSISNKTTQEFYKFILNKNCNISCLGFSATPNFDIKPFDNVISNYSIYDAYCDNVIVPPKIKWIKSEFILNDNDIINFCFNEIKNLYFKKIIIWCGMIELAEKLANLWSFYFDDFMICLDTSIDNSDFSSISDFNNREKNAILFCACKHREGSDIKNLDGCIFLDKVENRNSKTFVQCIGRVLRKDKSNKKKYGLVIDLKANSCLKICDRMNLYLNSSNCFPWNYNYFNSKINNKNIIVHELNLTNEENKNAILLKDNTVKDLMNKFVIKCPNNDKYTNRLYEELEIINEKNLCSYLLRARTILDLTKNIPHVTRGSCGSSLVCYLLGISNVDPIKYNIKFERFLNKYRNNLPDIDLDFPHFLRDEVFLKLQLTWPNQVARISNHVNWHDKSSLREAIRRVGIKKKIPKEDITNFVKKLSLEERCKITSIQNELNDTFRHYSLHCGGIVFFHNGIPDELLYNKNERKTISQIIYNKDDIAKHENFKIDILSSRAVSQLVSICGNNIDFSDCKYDEKTYKLFSSGDNIGITLGESPLIRKAFLKIKPKSITDLAICLAIIRPAAKDARVNINDIDFKTQFVFDDDAISLLSEYLNISYDLSDKFRRCIGKDKWDKDTKSKYDKLLNSINEDKKIELLSKLSNLRKYSFCKSHSYSYAQLIFKLAYQKTHNKKQFWISTLKNGHSSYRKWVHLYEAKLAGVDVSNYIKKSNDISIYAENRRKKFDNLTMEEQLRRFGYWDMIDNSFFPGTYFYEKEDNLFYFCGLIASLRILDYSKKTIVCNICVSPHKYIEVITKGKYLNPNSIALKGRANIIDKKLNTYLAFIAKYF